MWIFYSSFWQMLSVVIYCTLLRPCIDTSSKSYKILPKLPGRSTKTESLLWWSQQKVNLTSPLLSILSVSTWHKIHNTCKLSQSSWCNKTQRNKRLSQLEFTPSYWSIYYQAYRFVSFDHFFFSRVHCLPQFVVRLS